MKSDITRMVISSRTIGVLIIWVMLASFNHLAGCSSKETSDPEAGADSLIEDSTAIEIDTANYADWEILEHERVRFHYPMFHPQMGRMMDMAEAFSAAFERSAKFLRISPPDTVDFYFYTGPGQSQEMTGSLYAFVKDGDIHFTLPSWYGQPVAMYLLQRWAPGGTKYPFLKHGLIAMLDYSGQNYHEMFLNQMATDSFKTLIELSQDTAVDVNKERWQTAHGASFVDFFVVRYGIGKLKQLYTSRKRFADAVSATTGKPLEEIQEDWIRYAEAVMKSINENDRTQLDSILRMRGGQ